MTKEELKQYLQTMIEDSFQPHYADEAPHGAGTAWWEGRAAAAEDILLMLDELVAD